MCKLTFCAASHSSAEPPYSEASEILDMAVCCYPPGVFHFDDYITAAWAVSDLVELGIHHHSQCFRVIGLVFSGGLLPCLCKRTGTTQTSGEIPVHQRNSFLLLLAGKLIIIYIVIGQSLVQ